MRWRVAPSHFCLALVHALSAFGTWFTITATVALLNIKNYISWALTNHGKKKKTEIAWEKQSINFKTVLLDLNGWFLETLFAQRTTDSCQYLPHEEGASWVTGVSLLDSPGEFLLLSVAEFPGSECSPGTSVSHSLTPS